MRTAAHDGMFRNGCGCPRTQKQPAFRYHRCRHLAGESAKSNSIQPRLHPGPSSMTSSEDQEAEMHSHWQWSGPIGVDGRMGWFENSNITAIRKCCFLQSFRRGPPTNDAGRMDGHTVNQNFFSTTPVASSLLVGWERRLVVGRAWMVLMKMIECAALKCNRRCKKSTGTQPITVAMRKC